MPEKAPRSLASRLALATGLASAALIAAVMAVVLLVAFQRIDIDMEEHSENALGLLTKSLAVPLWSLDMDAARAIGLAVAQDDRIGLLEIKGARGEVLFRHSRGGTLGMERNAPVVHNGEFIGMVRLGISDSLHHAALWSVSALGVGLTVLTIALQFLLQSVLLKSLLRRPFDTLDGVVKAYAAGDFSPAQPEAASPEFAPLLRLLLDMGATIRGQVTALKESEQRLSLAMEAANDGLWDLDVPSGRTFFSPRYYTMLGYAPGEFEPSYDSWRGLMHPDDAGPSLQAMDDCLYRGKPYEVEFRLHHKNGTWRWILSRGTVVERGPGGEAVRMVGTHVDITETKQAREAMAQSEAKYRLLVEHQTDLMVKVDPEGRFLYASPSYCRAFGRSEEELLSAPFIPLVHEDDRAATMEAMKGLERPPHTAYMEQRALTMDGWRWLAWNDTAIVGPDGKIREIIGVGRDITGRKQAEQALRRSEEKFSQLFRLSPDASVLVSLDTRRLSDVNDSWVQLFGYSRGEALGRTTQELATYADTARRDELYARLYMDGRLDNFEIEARRKDGGELTLLFSGRVLPLDGRDHLLGVFRDISERKQAEKALAASEEKFSQLFRLAPEASVLVDMETRRLSDVNDAWVNLFGIPREEALGRTTLELQTYTKPAQREQLYELIHQFGRVDGFEIEGRHRNGDILTLLIANRVLDINGRPHLVGVFMDITERKRAEQALLASEERFSRAFSANPAALIISEIETGRFLAVNDSWVQLIGWTREEQIGRTSADLGIWLEPGQRESAMETLKRQGSLKNRFGRLLTKDGRVRASLWSAERVRQGGQDVLLSFVFDVTERVDAEAALRQSEEKFSRLFRLSPDAIVLINLATEQIQDANETFLRIFGHPREEVLGRTTKELGLYANLADRQAFFLRMRAAGHVESMEVEARRKDGSTFICSLSSQVLDLGGKPHILSILRDVTETKKMQEMMVQTEKMISVGGIAAGIAHEINNPLGIVLQAAQNLVQRTRGDFPKNREVAASLGLDLDRLTAYMQARKLDAFIEDIRSAALRAAGIIRNMLDFSRRSESRRKVCDLPEIARKALALAHSDYDLKKSYDFKKIRVDIEMDDELPVVNCTETEIEQVLLNLLRNSAQAMAEADPPVAEPHITIRLGNVPGFARIEVQDNGPGMPADVQRRVFEPFFTTKAPGVGTGLGLSVSYFIVTKGHGGNMRVESRPGQGARFILDLPAAEEAQ